MHKKRKLLGFTQAPASLRKVCDENERNKQKNDARVKILLMEGWHLWGICEKLAPWISTSFKSMIADTMKVLFVY